MALEKSQDSLECSCSLLSCEKDKLFFGEYIILGFCFTQANLILTHVEMRVKEKRDRICQVIREGF